jgi:hypothetical protein
VPHCKFSYKPREFQDHSLATRGFDVKIFDAPHGGDRRPSLKAHTQCIDFYANPYLFHDALQQCGLLRRILENLTPGG